MSTKYLDPTTDSGFKHIFGEEESKPILKHFLFDLLELSSPIEELTFLSTVRAESQPKWRSLYPPSHFLPPPREEELFDICCQDEKGQQFIIKMQKTEQLNFRDRALFYSMYALNQQDQREDWDNRLNAVYYLGILDFTFDDGDEYIHHIGLADTQTHDLFSEKLQFVYVELPKFNLTLDQLERDQDKWIYFLKHITELREIPDTFSEEPFRLAFHQAEVAQLTDNA